MNNHHNKYFEFDTSVIICFIQYEKETTGEKIKVFTSIECPL